jgi:hypothetical protein
LKSLLPLILLPGYGFVIVISENTSTDTAIIHGAMSGENIYKIAESNISMPDI